MIQTTRIACWLMCITLTAVGGISCVQIPASSPNRDRTRAIQILQQSAAAQGADAFGQLQDVTVQYEGKWAPFIARIQPVLIDDQFRGGSEERYLIQPPAMAQTHSGPGGRKQVFRDSQTIRVWYQDMESHDQPVLDAAALVADAYRMFLFGPRFFLERNASLEYLGTDNVDEMPCDQLLAILKPGLGNSTEDRVILSIDLKHHWLRRVRMTLTGLDSTRGAIVDIFLRDHVRIAGVVWPTRFYEELKRPLDLSVHRWRLTEIDFNRGLTPQKLKLPHSSNATTRPVGILPISP